jgi:hypothetical protein
LEAIDATTAEIRAQQNLLPLDLPEGYVEQMQAAVRFTEQDDLGKLTVGYRSTGPDDALHAEVYDLVAQQLWAIRRGMIEAQQELYQPLDELLEFERSRVSDYQSFDEYSPGPPEPDISYWLGQLS